MGLICREIVLRWRSKKLEVGKVNSMKEILKYSGCGGPRIALKESCHLGERVRDVGLEEREGPDSRC